MHYDGGKRVLRENRNIQLLLEFWPYGLKEAGSNWKELIQMLRDLSIDPMLVRMDGLIPFQARDVRSDSAWYVNLFASRGNPELIRIMFEPVPRNVTWLPRQSL